MQNRAYGGMPIQLGYCNGSNHLLNCLEYHRDSEVDIAADDVILLLGKQDEIENGVYSTDKVAAFLLPAGMGVELYATTLHYAPCNGPEEEGFRVVIVLPRGTNTDKPEYRAAVPGRSMDDGAQQVARRMAESSEAAIRRLCGFLRERTQSLSSF